jgi:hypothetical protein
MAHTAWVAMTRVVGPALADHRRKRALMPG